MLIQEGASVNFPDRRGNTSIHLASQRKELDILQVLSQAANPVPDFNARNFAGKQCTDQYFNPLMDPCYAV